MKISDLAPFYHSRGICPNEIELTPENAPQVANAMLEALVHHNRRQSEARDCQEYQRQQDNTESPMANFPPPTPVDWDEPMDLEGLEGATAVPQPSSSATTVPPPSSSITLTPAKKKVISIEEYNCRWAADWQLASAYLDRDENGEDLDSEDFQPQDDPANIQISYQMPMPVPHMADLPLLQDATSLASHHGHHYSSPRCDYSNAPGQHRPWHHSGHYSTSCHHCSQLSPRLQQGIAGG